MSANEDTNEVQSGVSLLVSVDEASLRAARDADRVVLVETRPFAARNHAGAAAARSYRRLRDRATVVDDGDVVGAVAEAVGTDRASDPVAPGSTTWSTTDRGGSHTDP